MELRTFEPAATDDDNDVQDEESVVASPDRFILTDTENPLHSAVDGDPENNADEIKGSTGNSEVLAWEPSSESSWLPSFCVPVLRELSLYVAGVGFCVLVTILVMLGKEDGASKHPRKMTEEYVAAVPNSGNVTWFKLTYPSDLSATSLDEVVLSEALSSTAAASEEALGAWGGLQLGGTPTLTARVWGDELVGMLNIGVAPPGGSGLNGSSAAAKAGGGEYPGGCCADTLRVFPRSRQHERAAFRDVDIYSLVKSAFRGRAVVDNRTGDAWAYANHAFDMTSLSLDAAAADDDDDDDDDEGHGAVALVIVAYKEAMLGGVLVDAIVAVDVRRGELVRTQDGLAFFSLHDRIGTVSTEPDRTIYKIQYHSLLDDDAAAPTLAPTVQVEEEEGNATSSGKHGAPLPGHEQYHENGVTRFLSGSTSSSGDAVWVLAFTTKWGGAVLLKDPFTYTAAEGGGSILQRFGSPMVWSRSSSSPSTRNFGLEPDAVAITALHNAWHTAYPDGRDTLTLFVNEREAVASSSILEFDVNLVPEPESGLYNASIFDTSYVSAKLNYSVNTWGECVSVLGGGWGGVREGKETSLTLRNDRNHIL